MELTAAQLEATITLDRHLAVTAGPGSGKTRVLVERYLNILEREDAGVENIVAITFSNKSANEMRERIRTQIDLRIDATRRTARENVWRERKRRLESAIITTIHGFCSRLLRESPVEAVVDPQFAMLDEYTASVMLDLSAQTAVTDLINEETELGAHLVAAYGRAPLVGHLISVYSTLRGLGVSIDEVEAETYERMLSPDAYRARLEAVDSHIQRGLEIVEREVSRASKERSRANLHAFETVFASAKAELGHEPSVDRAAAFAGALRALQDAAPTKQGPAQLKPWVDELRGLIGEKKAESAPGAIELAFYDASGRSIAPILLRALRGLDAMYSAEKRSAATLDFDDLQIRARDLLRTHPAVVRRARSRYKYFLVDEFQDTNTLQRDIVDLLALGEPMANLFIVGDRKQSIYAFRGAEVEVFAQAVSRIDSEGGGAIRLAANFRSDGRLVGFFNDLFSRLMRPEPSDDPAEIEQLGFVGYDPGDAVLAPSNEGPAVELLLHVRTQSDDADGGGEAEGAQSEETAREREAVKLAGRLVQFVEGGEHCVRDTRSPEDAPVVRPARYGDIAILLRAMTSVKTYERALRIAGVPYYVVAGKGFYDRQETTDILNLLAFVDNRSDELALAAILRSPLFGISDDTLLALRADRLGVTTVNRLGPVRTLFDSARQHRDDRTARLISDEQHDALDEALRTLELLLDLRNRVPVSELIRVALRRTDYEVVAAAADDGGQQLSNLDKLVAIARQFELGSMRLLRDFIEYVRDFRRLEGRESEASVRSDSDAVAILTVHKAKGLEFPIVVVPDLQREFIPYRPDVMYERGSGLAFKVPDGRGTLARTALYAKVSDRRGLRERFESMRLLYVATTRAQDRLILSGASSRSLDVNGPLRDAPSWLHWIVESLSYAGSLVEPEETCLSLGESELRVLGASVEIARPERRPVDDEPEIPSDADGDEQESFIAVEHVKRMLGNIAPSQSLSVQRFGTTSLQVFANCPRQFYYSRLLRLPELSGNSGDRDPAERIEPGDHLPASLRGLIIHRFCETFLPGDDLDERLRASIADVRASRGDAFADVLVATDDVAALAELRKLARNYVGSPMRQRVEERLAAAPRRPDGRHEFVRSELSFTLRVPEGFVHGTIDKLLMTPLPSGRVRATIVDFKTGSVSRDREPLESAIERAATEYRLQMQIYALAIRTLMPEVSIVEATLHFLQPGAGVEYDFPAEVVAEARASSDLERVLGEIVGGGLDPTRFDARPGRRCRSCAFASVCPEGLSYGR